MGRKAVVMKEDELLAVEVRKYPVLYDKTNLQYKEKTYERTFSFVSYPMITSNVMTSKLHKNFFHVYQKGEK